ncbi:MAG: PQQ-binding-like beta-propeller repeat protein [Verrucomicrobiae bacterium]|nr:PQQ-binding-like beta-propeller repeat protein [Verrucomicrobiae bacterium]
MNPRFLPTLAILAIGIRMGAPDLSATDWPRWLGPDGSNRTRDPAFVSDLSKYSTAWEAKIGRGYSAVSVAEGRAFVLGHDGQAGETVYCLDAVTGRELWKHTYPAELLPRMHPGGPNATPTVTGNRVLTLSKDGQLFCLDTADGTRVWEVNLPAAMGVAVPQWGFGSSPVVSGQQVWISAGKVIALELATGRTVWVSTEAHPPAYASPVPFAWNGRPFIAAMNGRGLSVLSATDGAEIAHRPLKAQFDLLAPTPIVLDQGRRIFISANASSELLTFDGEALNLVWETRELKNALNNSVALNGTIYGIDGRQGTPNCRLVALNLADGRVLWTRDNFGYGTTIGVDDVLLALTENGELVTTRLSPAAYAELGRTQVLGRTCWTSPTVAHGRIYARNDQGNLICLSAE